VKVKVRPYGTHALLAQPRDRAAVLPLAEALTGRPEVLEAVPAARTVLVRCATARDVATMHGELAALARSLTARDAAVGDGVDIDVVYDGADLADTAQEVGLDADGLVRVHSDADYVVAFCGFAPGFAYLTGLPERLQVSRHPEPRTSVPAGSLGIAGEFTGVYPRSSPGGWRLLGHTDAPLWDLARDPPALLPPGTRVRFRPA
jgi:KipI family sensor histidine kinase inhibitor